MLGGIETAKQTCPELARLGSVIEALDGLASLLAVHHRLRRRSHASERSLPEGTA